MFFFHENFKGNRDIGCNKMTTPPGILGLYFGFCLIISILFFLCLFVYFLAFTVLACIPIVMHHFKRTHLKI